MRNALPFVAPRVGRKNGVKYKNEEYYSTTSTTSFGRIPKGLKLNSPNEMPGYGAIYDPGTPKGFNMKLEPLSIYCSNFCPRNY
jgi:hypothetical protein